MTSRTNRTRPPYPAASNAAPIQDTWRCLVCGVVRGVRTGWKIVRSGPFDRLQRICKPCWELRHKEA